VIGMSEQLPSEAEQRIRAAFDAGNLEASATAAVEAYGDQILSFIASRLNNERDAQEAFSMFAEDLWIGLPKFGWRCSMRTWCYALARNAATRYAKAPARRGARNVPLSRPGVLSNMVETIRSATRGYQQTAVKDRFRALREQLDPEDQMLLVLRVDRELSWQDLAMTMSGDVDMSEELKARESTRLRKAFERLKVQLRRLAERDGLLDG
jgi:RNA polymerase sigma-70 factor (ECF subfamily)